ncbi:FHA domain-containing protein [Streptomyces sp. KAU_LT]|uniref:FHA domain-containing protein n=1 Tax=Streptomyces sp. KAU_LT TaxID=3046669 RepID=UPI0024B86386|nr:FHA domain-containing protein [Streptomyces sp. KAU_LT]MDI9836444.1 FHA domain-containing protein [Streptomyces sp. KAU_LT]
MQIRLTVVDPLAPPSAARGAAASCDVLVTAPAGTALSAVASALASAVSGESGAARGAESERGGGPVVLYAGTERLDDRRSTLGEPPLTDGAVLSLGAPAAPEPHPELDDAPTQLHVVAGPDAGGVHLLHGGEIRVGRSADADVPLDDPDVSRLHCAVTVGADGRVAVADLGSTNGTTLDGTRLTTRPVRFVPGALLRLGESTLRLAPAGGPGARVPTEPDGEGHVRVCPRGGEGTRAPGPPAHARVTDGGPAPSDGPAAREHTPAAPPVVPAQGRAPHAERTGAHGSVPHPRGGDTHATGFEVGPLDGPRPVPDAGRPGTGPRGTDGPAGARRRGGLSAWARRLAGGRGEPEPADEGTYDEEPAEPSGPTAAGRGAMLPETWPDPASLLLTALGPGPRLWERAPGHPEALTVRLGTADRAAPDGSGLLPAVPVTADLREAGALGLAGPRERLAGLTRAVLAQLAALHSPDTLEIVLVSADRARPVSERTAEWAWLGWLPHVRPGHGQDCRLLLAHDREQATARVEELLRRLEDLTDHDDGGRAPDGRVPAPRAAGHRPSWARHGEPPSGSAEFTGPYSVLVVDGDPGGADLREAVARLALEGPRAGIHVVCLAETAAASPASPVTDTYEAACAVAPAFRACGAVALLSGDVATALRLLRVAPDGAEAGQEGAVPGVRGPVGHGTVATVDAVSAAWAERFARALAPLRTDRAAGEGQVRVSVPLPQSARLLDELGLARATPASLMARWADAADDPQALGGRVTAVLGAGPHGPVGVDLGAEGPHLLVEGPPAAGRTELLRAVVASLAAAERPDRLGIVLIDGRDSTGAGGGHGDGLGVCTDVPHVTTHLTANDPVRMREFAQSLSAELKRRAELLGRSDFTEWHTGRALTGRMIAQRAAGAGAGAGAGDGDLESPPSATIRLRPGAAARRQADTVPPLPRLVVVVDDLDALVHPSLGSPGRPAAGSVIRALEAVARDGERLGVHLVAATGLGGRAADSEPARCASLRVTLDAVTTGPDAPAPGRGRLVRADGRAVPFQGGRVTGRIPRTATLRPTVVPLEWHRMGDPPARRPVRELGNGPTDLALLASALERATREVSATEVPSLL